jgi:hypothetical protein
MQPFKEEEPRVDLGTDAVRKDANKLLGIRYWRLRRGL